VEQADDDARCRSRERKNIALLRNMVCTTFPNERDLMKKLALADNALDRWN
jgi:hypothetical protein